jgi:hypothetical protein
MASGGDAPRAGSAVLVLSWTPASPRSEALARALGGRAEGMPWARAGQPRGRTIAGWLRSAHRTAVLIRDVPAGGLLVVMCPPVFAPLVALPAGRLRHLVVVFDLHSGAVNDGRWAWSHGLLGWLARRADAVLVTNAGLLSGGGVDVGRTPVVLLHDPLPPGQRGTTRAEHEARDDRALAGVPLPSGPWVLFPASGSMDEPLDALADAATRLRGDLTVVVTGHPALAGRGLWLTGHLPDDAYAALVRRAPVVLALTTREDTMQRAAYEALIAGRALVCSDRRVLREAFGEAAVYVGDDADALVAGLREGWGRRPELEAAVPAVRARLRAEVARGLATLRHLAAAGLPAPAAVPRGDGRDQQEQDRTSAPTGPVVGETVARNRLVAPPTTEGN